MQKHQLYINLLVLSSAFALAACADKGGVEDVVTPPVPEPEPEIVTKTPIVLSVGGEESNILTRAVITDGTDNMEPFDVDTKIFMIMKSVYDTSHPDYQVTGTALDPKYTVSRGDVKKKDDTNSGMSVTFDENNQKYWDDAHARSTKLNIWAYAQKGMSWTECSFAVDDNSDNPPSPYKKQPYETTENIVWKTTPIYPLIFNWKASHHDGGAQSETSVMCQDLLFSNNLVDNASSLENGGTGLGGSDKSLKFDFTNRTFPTDNVMRFYHAMAKITINIKEGDGFITTGDNASSDFKFTSTNIKLTNFNTEGLFSIQQGIFQQINNHSDIPSIYHKTNTATLHVLEALVVPNIDEFMQGYDTPQHDDHSRFVKDDATNVMMEFSIDNNKYQITSGMLYNVLTGKTGATEKTNNGTYIPLEAGKNYVFTFTIGKTAINNITATVASWQNVEANELTPSNTYVNLLLKTDEGTAVNTADPQVDLYRAKDPNTYNGSNYNDWAKYDWNTGYTVTGNKATLTQSAIGGTVYTAKDASNNQWVWPNNDTYYHFRTINTGLTVQTPDGSEPKDYVSISSGAISDDNDYLWGAPFKPKDSNLEYSTITGFCNAETNAAGQIYKAIGATKDNITLIQHHMMSNIFVDLETTIANPVNLTGATVKILRYAKDAKLLMGNGLVTELSNYDDGAGTAMKSDAHDAVAGPPAIPAYDYSYRVVPQPLSYTEGSVTKTIGMEITTADGNVYKIPNLSTHTVNGTSTVIGEWLPGKNYYYKFVLKKTGIDNITATVVDWENIVATPDDEVVIE